MPISQMLPDGRVRVFNKKTGQTKDVRPEELGAISPNLVGEYQTLQANVQGVSSGQLSPTDLPQEQRSLTATGLEAGGFDPAKKEAEIAKQKQNVKNKLLLDPTEKLIDNLEMFYQASGGGKYKGPLAGIIGKGKSVSSALGLNSNVRTYEDTKKGFIATLKGLTGDVGVMTEQDAARLAALVPEIGRNPEEAKNQFNILRSQIAAKYGGAGEQTAIDPGKGEILPGFLVDPYKRTGQTIIGAGQAVAGLGAEKLGKPQFAQNIYGADILGSQKQMQKKPSELLSGQALDSASILLDALGLKGLGKLKGKGIKPEIPAIFSKTKLGVARDAAISAADEAKTTFSGADIAKVGKDFVSRNPEMSKTAKEIIPELEKKTLNTKTLVKQIQEWSAGTYDKAGDVRSTQLAKLHNVLADAGRKELRDKAPEVAKVNQLFSKLYGREKLAKKAGYAAVASVPTAGAYLLLSKLLGGGGSR